MNSGDSIFLSTGSLNRISPSLSVEVCYVSYSTMVFAFVNVAMVSFIIYCGTFVRE